MKKSEVAQLLAWCQTVDGRPINELSVEAWHDLLGDFDYKAALNAAREHYRESTVMLKPAHITQRLDVDAETGPLRDASAELQAEQKATWCAEHGITEAQYDAAIARGDKEWLMDVAMREPKAVTDVVRAV